MWGKVFKFGLPLFVLVALGVLMYVASRGLTFALVDTHGIVATQQRDLLYFATGLMLVIIIPVFVLLFWFAYRYNEKRTNARYSPNWNTNKLLETIWWGIPILIIVVLSVVTWQSSHSLDPYRPLASSKPPTVIQVVALQWKWLFLYPEDAVASVNEVAFPVERPVRFVITSDAPMNSFWIPQLGGQIYAMSGMVTQLNLDADTVGDYRGLSANISGEGHSQMNFTAKALSYEDYQAWQSNARQVGDHLEPDEYEVLRQKSLNNPVTYYHLHNPELFDTIISRYSHGMKHGG